MSNKTFGRIALGIAVLISLSTFARCFDKRESEWEARVERVEEYARGQERLVAEAKAEADSLSDLADERLRASEGAEEALDARIDTVRVETPEDLRGHPSVVARDSIIDAQGDLLTQTRLALAPDCGSSVDLRADLAQAAAAKCKEARSLRLALGHATARGDSLRDVLADRPGGRPWFLPRLGIGVAAGLDGQGKPRTIAGGTLSWEIKL